MRIKTAWSTLGKILLIVVVTALFVYPFWWMVVNSLNTAAQVFGKPTLLPVSWRWENYKEIFQIQPFGRHLFNSILVALIGTTGNVIISALSGYAFARIRFPGREALFILLLTALMMPIEVIIVPLFFQMRDWGFNDSLKPLMLIPIFGAQGAFSCTPGRTGNIWNLLEYYAPAGDSRNKFHSNSRISGRMEHIS